MNRHYEQCDARRNAIIDASFALLNSGINKNAGGQAILADCLRRLVRKHGEISEFKGGKYLRMKFWSSAALRAYRTNRAGYKKLIAIHHPIEVDDLVKRLLRARTRKGVADIYACDCPCVVLRAEHDNYHKRGARLSKLVRGPNAIAK